MPDGGAENQDQKPGGPQRLQGLSSRGGRGGLRGGRFMPNSVGRRSKEERESTAPALKPPTPGTEDGQDRAKPGNRSKFDRRKQRQLGTRAEAAGPLAAPTIAATSSAARVPRAPAGSMVGSVSSSSSGGEFGSSASVRVKTEVSSTFASLPDERIDMASGGDGESYFPLRMPSDAVSKDSPSADPAAGEAIAAAKAEETRADPEAPGETEAELERDLKSHELLQFENGDFLLLQLPDLGLEARKPPPSSLLHSDSLPVHTARPANSVTVKDENVEMADAPVPDVPDESMDMGDGEPKQEADPVGPAGRLGTLRKHASGKLTMVIGDAVYEVLKGTHGASLEEVMLFNEAKKQVYPVGSVKSRVLVIPDLDSLHI